MLPELDKCSTDDAKCQDCTQKEQCKEGQTPTEQEATEFAAYPLILNDKQVLSATYSLLHLKNMHITALHARIQQLTKILEELREDIPGPNDS